MTRTNKLTETDSVLDPCSVPKHRSPDRLEVVMQAYLAEATLASSAHYYTTNRVPQRQKWSTLRLKVLKGRSIYMPKERRDLNSVIITKKAI